ncbi:carbohydrate ABC transporter permease [Paenibacillus chondroitinus]|uniref:Carbohydrate ABC transporter permease n=1 Tax=Paenibacillus chondroitinus TaxID=59842 RepID=A0ABU6D9P2_9BACL|nr:MULTISPECIES: carbohydrate ABC transporter permease [Paenibacillus]MCY9656810.1 carbohydrate ABC transporter permease [Paenibacillus anseongense]MEB4794460.1 carbohydrate ABC transporter permease [Paenibacillus chondroitinus]
MLSLSQKNTLLRSVLTVLLLSIGILMVLPFLWMASASFKNQADIFEFPIRWIPKAFDWSNYQEVWLGKVPYYVFYINSIKITFLQVLGSLVTSSLAGFAFARLRFQFRDSIFLIYLATMIVPPQVLFVPRFILFDYLNLVNTHEAIILPGMFTVLGTFLMRQFFSTLPTELFEASKIDGAGYWRMYWQISLPLVKPALVTLLILTFTWHWNEYENPLILLRDRDLFTIPLGLLSYTDGENSTNYPLIMAASVLALAPLVIIVCLCQRWFVEGIANTGLKG